MTTIRSLAFSPDGKLLAAGTGFGEGEKVTGFVKLWDLATGQVRATLGGHEPLAITLAFSPDSTKLAAAAGWGNSGIKLSDLEAEPPRVERQWEGCASSVVFSADGKTLAAALGSHLWRHPLRSEA